MQKGSQPIQRKIPSRQIQYKKGHLEFKLHPLWALSAFFIFLFTVAGGIFLFVDANYKGKIDNKDAENERLSFIITKDKERLERLETDSISFVSMKNKIRTGDTSGISPKELIIIDSLTQEGLVKENRLKQNDNLITNLNRQNQELIDRIKLLTVQSNKGASSTIGVTKFIHDTVKLIVKDTIKIVVRDTITPNDFEIEEKIPIVYASLGSTMDEGFSDPSGFTFGITSMYYKTKKVDVNVLRPGEVESKEYKNIASGASWASSVNGVKYVLTLTSLQFHSNQVFYKVKVTKVQ